MPLYTITLTARDGLKPDQIGVLKEYLDRRCESAYVVNEFGSSGLNSHLQGVCDFKDKKTSNITGGFKTVYRKNKWEVVNNITIRIKKVSELGGAFSYASKELKDKNPAKEILVKGWRKTWITTQIHDYQKRTPVIQYKHDGIRLTNATGPSAMYQWCMAHDMQITNKAEFIQVGKLMTCDDFQFGGCRTKGLFMDVCGKFKNGDALEKIWENDLFFI